MFYKLFKIVFFKAKKYFAYIFLALLLSFFSYILGNNLIVSVEKYLAEQIQPLLGGDIVISGDSQIENTHFDSLSPYVEVASSITIDSTLFNKEEKPELFSFIYHSDNYPFYNSFSWAPLQNSGSILTSDGVMKAFGNSLDIFDDNLVVKGIINKGPLSNFSLYASDNKVYIPDNFWKEDLEDTGRISYKYFFKWKQSVSEVQKNKIIDELKSTYDDKDYFVQTTQDRNENIAQITDRFYNFIHLFNIIIFLLTFFIVFLSLESFYKHITKDIGLLNILGMTKRYIFYVYAVFLFFIFLLAFGAAFGGNYLLFEYIPEGYSFIQMYSISLIKAFGILLVLFFTGAGMIFLKISRSRLSDLLTSQTEFSRFTKKDYVIYIALLLVACLLINIISGISILWSFIYSFIYIGVITLFYIFIFILLNLIWKTIKNRIKNFYIFDSIRSTIKPGNVSFLFIFSSLISLLSIFIFYVFSASFLSFLDNLSSKSNDMFVLNVQSQDLENISTYFDESEIYETVTIRIETINNLSLEEHFESDDIPYDITREFFSATNISNDPLAAGSILKSGGVSIENMFGEYLGVGLGDTIKFSVAGLEKELVVTSLRDTNRTAGKPFFFFELYKQDFTKYPKTYFLNYKQSEKPADLPKILSDISQSNLTFINTKEIFEIIQSITQTLLLVIYVCLIYIFIFAILGFGVSIQFLTNFKKQKSSLLHILGGNKNAIRNGLFFEYSYLIIIGALFSIFLGTIFLYILFGFLEVLTLDFLSYIQGVAGVFLISSIIIIILRVLKIIKK